jgi:hypothetical protein
MPAVARGGAGGGGGAEEFGSLWMSSGLSTWHDPVLRGHRRIGGLSTAAVVEPSVGRRAAGTEDEGEGETKRGEGIGVGRPSPPPCDARCETAAVARKRESWLEWLERPSKHRLSYGLLGDTVVRLTDCLTIQMIASQAPSARSCSSSSAWAAWSSRWCSSR